MSGNVDLYSSWKEPHVPELPHSLPVTNATVLELYGHLFAPWVKGLGLHDFSVSAGEASAVLPQGDALKLYAGSICGQVIMAALDTVITLAMFTTERIPKGTVYQHTHFLRPAIDDDLRVQAKVLRFGKASAFAEGRVTLAGTGALVAHASSEFAF
jgi:acyl-coenzyme A thioesterase PaaI-like protein